MGMCVVGCIRYKTAYKRGNLLFQLYIHSAQVKRVQAGLCDIYIHSAQVKRVLAGLCDIYVHSAQVKRVLAGLCDIYIHSAQVKRVLAGLCDIYVHSAQVKRVLAGLCDMYTNQQQLTENISQISLLVVLTGSTEGLLSTSRRLVPSVSRIHSLMALNSPSSLMMILFLASCLGRCM